MSFNQRAAEAAVRDLLIAVGEDPEREGLLETPARVARAWKELLSGLDEDPAKHLEKHFTVETDEMVLVRDIEFHSVCEHHLLPFHGRAHVAYIPRDNKVTGLSKLARVVEGYARRPQVQERLTTQIAQALVEKLNPQGVCVIMEAEHLCMTMRGIRKTGATTVTSKLCGVMNNSATRQEMMTLVMGGNR
ncbi:GTP cyclohydrolase I [Gleimia coleocanis DSM 15436]|uniref:GTP cyclohydrolase 1 n=1 Tax=Gleimia coleocanis DSM 15436 TaxID=525245 RepID=C0VYV9_9ACTO|nr:GTP cyclohydrolase I FolE [Gleimia coleocanis]EEH64612.1 GTP cyclohydrolase I [Gleimia coleocanis DSM 15436]